MIKERNIVVCIILSIITCGIYGIYWLVCMVNDVNVAADTPNDTSGGVVFLLSIITCNIYFWFWCYKAGEKIQLAQQKRGLPSDSQTCNEIIKNACHRKSSKHSDNFFNSVMH